MPSDRARFTFDRLQRFRAVVMQQGRVQLEADWNEAHEIASEELRATARDVVGVFGTPDDGYLVSDPDPATREFSFNGGIMYMGGIRVSLPRRVKPYPYLDQPDWKRPLPHDPDAEHEFVFLEVREQEISAVEAPSLREPALGGPDTAQRLRLMQRVRRIPIRGDSCAEAWDEMLEYWKGEGAEVNRSTMTVRPAARLEVGFDNDNAPPDPCDPIAEGGYLHADNQLIRVAVSAPGKIVWSFDNASAIYRVTAYDAAAQTLKLQERPVDDEHRPRKEQVVELLRGDATLSDGSIVAEPFGPIVTLSAGYSADDKTITLTNALPAGYDPATVRLYVRIWEAELPFTAGTAVSLGGETGLNVTLTSTLTFVPGDYWTFAARPSTPKALLPDRYRKSPQPPEGFRRWIAPLAVLNWTKSAKRIITDCREHFDDLVELTKRKQGCCIRLTVSQLRTRTINDYIDEHPNVPIRICLEAGTYLLREPIIIRRNNVTIEGCDAVTLRAEKPDHRLFRAGLIQIVGAIDVTLRRLTIEPPRVPIQLTGMPHPIFEIVIGVAVRVASSIVCTIEHCSFPMNAPNVDVDKVIIFAGILLNGAVNALNIRANSFAGSRVRPKLFEFGIVGVPAFSDDGPDNFRWAPSRIEFARIQENGFGYLTAASLVWTRSGEISIRENMVIDSTHGFIWGAERWFASIAFHDYINIRDVVTKDINVSIGTHKATIKLVTQSMLAVLQPDVSLFSSIFATLPLPDEAKLPDETGILKVKKPAHGYLIDRIASLSNSTFVEDRGSTNGQVLSRLEERWKAHELMDFGMRFMRELRELDLTKIYEIDDNDNFKNRATIDFSHNKVIATENTPQIDGVCALFLCDAKIPILLHAHDKKTEDVTTFLPGVDFEDFSRLDRITFSTNDLRTFSNFNPTALLLFPARATVTGNVVENKLREEPEVETTSLMLIPRVCELLPNIHLASAVTGNVFVAWPVLPKHTMPFGSAAMSWFEMNTIIAQ